MKELLIAAAYNAIRAYLGTGVFDRVSQMVRNLIYSSAYTGEQKKELVIAFARGEFETIRTRVIEAIIAVTLLRFDK
jgi:hypothetical protein